MGMRNRTHLVVNLVVACAITTALVISPPVFTATAPAAQEPPPPSGPSRPVAPAAGVGTGFLQGTMGADAWWPAMVQDAMEQALHIKHFRLPPAPYPGHGAKRFDKKTDEMLTDINQEYARRVNVLMAVYQASGGDKRASVVEPLGIAEATGGLRSLEEQHEIYKECRRLKKGGNKNKPEDWELIPPAERVGKWGAKNEPMWTEAPGMSVPVLAAMPRVIPLAPNCPVVKAKKAGNVVYEFMGPVTSVWQSYDNLGLAVDLVERIRDPDDKQKTKEALPNDPEGGTGPGFHEAAMAWYNLLRAAEALGMRAGSYWRDKNGRPDPDPAHYEWHPKIHDINNAPAPKTPGKALNDDQVDAGYAWKIPQKLYVTSPTGLSQASVDLATTVFELVEDH